VLFIISLAGLASHRRSQLSSNVRHRKYHQAAPHRSGHFLEEKPIKLRQFLSLDESAIDTAMLPNFFASEESEGKASCFTSATCMAIGRVARIFSSSS